MPLVYQLLAACLNGGNMKVLKWTEHNDHEGESWHVYFNLEGNVDAINLLFAWYDENEPEGYELKMEDKPIEYLQNLPDDSGYYPYYEWDDRKFDLPRVIEAINAYKEGDDWFYKLNIQALMIDNESN